MLPPRCRYYHIDDCCHAYFDTLSSLIVSPLRYITIISFRCAAISPLRYATLLRYFHYAMPLMLMPLRRYLFSLFRRFDFRHAFHYFRMRRHTMLFAFLSPLRHFSFRLTRLRYAADADGYASPLRQAFC